MEYTNYFKEIVSLAYKEDLYVGMGNPNGKVLIIGKELAIDNYKENPVAEKTLKQNAADWQINVENPNNHIENCESNDDLNLFNPLYPYKGMGKNQQPTGHTWRKYQLLQEKLFEKKSNEYTFYNDFFITELNQIPSKYSKLQNKELRYNSIQKRIDLFLKSDFIQNFQVVIVACGHYPRENGVDICELFNIDYLPPTRHVDDNPKQWYNLHNNKSGNNPKLVIHTRQLSMDVTNKLIEEITKEISFFCEQNKIAI